MVSTTNKGRFDTFVNYFNGNESKAMDYMVHHSDKEMITFLHQQGRKGKLEGVVSGIRSGAPKITEITGEVHRPKQITHAEEKFEELVYKKPIIRALTPWNRIIQDEMLTPSFSGHKISPSFSSHKIIEHSYPQSHKISGRENPRNRWGFWANADNDAWGFDYIVEDENGYHLEYHADLFYKAQYELFESTQKLEEYSQLDEDNVKFLVLNFDAKLETTDTETGITSTKTKVIWIYTAEYEYDDEYQATKIYHDITNQIDKIMDAFLGEGNGEMRYSYTYVDIILRKVRASRYTEYKLPADKMLRENNYQLPSLSWKGELK